MAAAGVGIAVIVLLLGLAQLRLPAVTPGASFGDFLLGALVVAVVQTAVALPLWWQRTRALTRPPPEVRGGPVGPAPGPGAGPGTGR